MTSQIIIKALSLSVTEAGDIEALAWPFDGHTTTPGRAKVENWTTLATVRAELLRRSLYERLAAFGEAEESTMGFRLYAVPSVEIATGDRVIWSGKALNIVDVQETQRGRVRALEIVCKQVTK